MTCNNIKYSYPALLTATYTEKILTTFSSAFFPYHFNSCLLFPTRVATCRQMSATSLKPYLRSAKLDNLAFDAPCVVHRGHDGHEYS